MRVGRPLFFAVAFAYLAIIGGIDLPTVHPFYDSVAIRDMATAWDSLTWDIRDERHFFPAAILGQHEGPLQFLVLNAYAYSVGHFLPLNPWTMHVPGTLLACGASVVLFLLLRRAASSRVAYLGVLAFVLSPLVGILIRYPWVFNLLSVLTEALVFVMYVGWARQPESWVFRAGAPLSLALYLTTAVDWPSVAFALALFLLLAGRLKVALWNRYNLIPAAILGVYVIWAGAIFVYGHWYDPLRAGLYQRAILLFPFFKVGTSGQLPSALRVLQYTWNTFGLLLIPALAGIVDVARERLARRGTPVLEPVMGSFRLAMAIWLIAALVPLLRTSNSETFGYVVAVPLVVMAATGLARLPVILGGLVLVVTMVVQLQAVSIRTAHHQGDDRRVLATATFLIEKRPDLLVSGKTVLLPGDSAANVGQYARGRNTRIVMPTDFPAVLSVHGVGSKEDVLRGFVDAYVQRGEIRADWLILTPELLEPSAPGSEFYRRLREDPRIRWVAVFRDQRGVALWIGEVGHSPAAATELRTYDVEPLAQRYEERYDWLAFLRRNVRYVMHD